jgi:hypothetical protein
VLALASGPTCSPALSRGGAEAGPDAASDARPPRRRVRSERLDPFLEELQHRTFNYFWELADPTTGLVPDRWPTPSFASTAAVGFGLTAITIGVERGWITREEGRERVLVTLRFFRDAPQGPQATGTAGYRGFYYHFLDMNTGLRYGTVELSTIDTAWLLAGVISCRSYFDGVDPAEVEIRRTADTLVRAADWTWAQPRPPLVGMGWTPEGGFIEADWHGYDEGMLLYVLALGSPTHPVAAEAWQAWTQTYHWAAFQGFEHVNFPPLFGHQYSHVWIDFRGIRDAVMRERGIDYFENSRRATLAQRAYAVANPGGWKGYGEDVWGLSACDGPLDGTVVLEGRPRKFRTYSARGAAVQSWSFDDGTVAPTAAGGSLPFAPAEATAALKEMHRRWGAHLWSTYGFLDAFNPTLDRPVDLRHGAIVPGVGWFDGDYIGIDQGPIVTMIENHRNGFVWRLTRGDAVIRDGLRRAGFSGGWLDAADGAREHAH